MVAEASGGWAEDALTELQRIARAESARTGQRAAEIHARNLQGLSVTVRTAAAVATLRRRRTGVAPRWPAHGADAVSDDEAEGGPLT